MVELATIDAPGNVGDTFDGRPIIHEAPGERVYGDPISAALTTNISSLTAGFIYLPAEDPINNIFAMNGQTLTGGVANYPALAAKWAVWVSGPDLVLPDWRGRAMMGLGGLGITGAAGDLFSDQNKSHSHIGGVSVWGAEAAFGTTTGGGGNNGVSNWDGTSTTKPRTSSEGGDQARPNAVGLVLCVIAGYLALSTSFDDYADDAAAALAGISVGQIYTDSATGVVRKRIV